VNDIGKIKMGVSSWEEPKYVVVDTEEDALRACTELRDYGELVIDIEVGIEKDTAFDHPNRYQMLCIGVAYADGKAVVFGETACKSEKVIRRLSSVLNDPDVKLIAQNGKFDLAGLHPLMGNLTLYFDTMIASYCLDERPGIHGLKYMAKEMLGAPDYEADIKRYVGPHDSYSVIPRDILYRYNAYDVVCTWSLYRMFDRQLHDQGLRGLHDFLVAASNQLMYMELNGIGIDLKYLDELTETYLVRLEELEKQMSDIGPAFGINPRSPKQIQELFHDQGINEASTDAATLESLLHRTAGDIHEFLRLLLRHRKEAKLYGTYVKGIRKRVYRGRVYPTFLLHGTTTGRLSCRNPNLQNIPRDSTIRRVFVPTKEDTVFVQADYSQAELRVATFLAQDEYFRTIFNDQTRDLFTELTPILYGDISHLDGPARKELRIRVKAYVYGLAYGREAYSIAQEFGITEKEAKLGMSRFFEVIPGIVQWRKDVQGKVLAGDDLVSPFGRHRRFWLITNDNREDILKEALAFLPQSTSSDICLSAATQLRQDLRGTAFLRNIVHDSILAECKESDAEEVAKTMNDVMVEKAKVVVGDYITFATETKVGRSWADV
jgi:DNA polymerase-1